MNNCHDRPTFRGRRVWALSAGLLLAAVSIGWFSTRLREAQQQRQAVAAVRQLGGWVFYDCRYDDSGWLKHTGPSGPRWLHRILGTDFLGTVHGVKLTYTGYLDGLGDFEFLSRPCPGVTDDALACLESFPQLQWLALSRTSITDAALERLGRLETLQRLWLDDTQVSNHGLEHLQALEELHTLSLEGTRVDDAGLVHLAPLVRLNHLRLDRTGCTLSGIIHLFTDLQHRSLAEALHAPGYARLDDREQIVTLDLSRARVRDADLRHLEQLAGLRWLHLQTTGVTDAGLVHLKGLTNLELLHLGGTAVTDAGLKSLGGLKRLQTLHLTGTQTTEEGVERLRRTLPRTLRLYR